MGGIEGFNICSIPLLVGYDDDSKGVKEYVSIVERVHMRLFVMVEISNKVSEYLPRQSKSF